MKLQLAALLVVAAGMAYGQAVSGSVVGSVADPSGALVPNAKVTLTEMATNLARVTNANQSGNYSFTNVQPGQYRVEVEQPGFRKSIRTNVDVQVNSTVRADFELQTGQVSESINVAADAAVLQTDRSDTGRKIETRQLADMPLTYNRNFQGLLNLVPGAIRTFRPHSEFFNAQDSLATRVNGQSRMSNNVQLEGVDNNQRTGLLTALIPPIEALQAVDVTTSNYEAELGRAGGAVMNVNFKSGTNELHGSAFEFNRVSRLGARSFFATRKPVTTYNMFGFTIGGPIIKNKTFFFGDYQGLRDRRGDIHRGTIPSLAFRNGDLSVNNAGTALAAVYDPNTGSVDGTGRTPFAGNQIPAARISPISRRLLALIPNPTFPTLTTNYETSTTRVKNTDAFDIKLDHTLNENNKVAIRHSYQRPEIQDPPLYGVKGGGFRDFAGTGIQESHNAQINYTRIFSPTIITELRVGFMYYRNNATNADRGLKTAEELGIPGVNVSDFTSGIPNIQINGFSNPTLGYSPSLPWERGEQNFNFVLNTTFIRGNHTIKVGVDHRRNRDELLQNQTFSPRGRFDFTEGTTQTRGVTASSFANSFASFLLDRPNQAGRDLPLIFPTYLQNPLFSYVQDKWQVNKKLTVDIGLRHELWPPANPRAKQGGFANYIPFNNTLEVAGVGSIPKNMGRKNYLTNFAPRFGMAYRHSDKTVVRMGYGISWVPLVDNGYAFNFPVRENNVFNANSAFEAAGSMATGFPAFVPFAIPSNGIISIPRTGGPAALRGAFNYVRPDVREGYVQSWNVAVQRQLPRNLVLDLAYVGNHGVGIMATENMNPGLVAGAGAGAGAAGQPLNQLFGRTSATNNIYFGTNTNYHSLQVKLDRRFSNGFSMTSSYTWSKAIDQSGGDNGGLWLYINPLRGRAMADGHRTHVFVQSYIYELPFGKGKAMATSGPAAAILGGWQVNGILTLQTGQPFNPSVAGSILNAPGNSNTPNLVGEWITPKVVGPEGSSFWFDPKSFANPANGTFGNLGRNRLTGPGFAHGDASIFRKFTLTERFNLELRAEAFNLTNTPHFGNPNGDITSPNFGKVVSVEGAPNGPREVQFGLKMIF